MDLPKALWRPSEDFIGQSNLKKFEDWLRNNKGLSFENYEALWRWSTENVAEFWESIWEYFEVKADQKYHTVLSGEMPEVQWFEGATLNYAEHLFRHKSNDRPALIFRSERADTRQISWKELEQNAVALKQYLLANDIGRGDRVAAYLPNIPDAIISVIAVNSLGAIWSCCSPDFGVNTVIDRLSQIEPKLLIATDGYQYNGKAYSRIEEVKKIRSQIGSIKNQVLIPYLDPSAKLNETGVITWEELMQQFSKEDALTFTPVDFSHPIWVLYSSGTTGIPKAITHSHGGVLLEHLKYMAFHNDVHRGENFFWYTTTGWMMWNFLQASMLVGATPVLFDGSPGFPNLDVLWQLSQDLPIHHFGTSAPYLTACMKQKLQPGENFDLSTLRSLGSTGAPLPPEAFNWIYQSVSKEVWLCSMSGGTDVCTAFVGGCPSKPVYKGLIQCRGLGCAMKAYDEDGKSMTGSVGEMVIEQPMPCMPIYFWNDSENQRYKASYFERFPKVWRHGDWINIYEDGSLMIQGRSDATLNRKGIRIGTAEIYSVLDGIPGIKDSLVLNLEKSGGDDIMPLFVVCDSGVSLTVELKEKINQALKIQCSPRHVPDLIIQAPDIPYTLSGKKMEVPAKKVLLGMNVSKTMNKDAVRNPQAFEFLVGFATRFRDQYL
ncbi:MAG: acetoacetate--CoA ligase [Cyclobacteriaceae bacterium]